MFKINNEYDRQELLDFVGSKQNQSGIIWGNKEPGCIIVTSGGKHGDSAGYGDTQNPDSTWNYVGQGSVGDQSENNFANAILIKEKRDVLLFTTREPSAKEQRERGNRRKRYKFEGIFFVLSHSFEIPSKGKRIDDRLIVFRLVPATNIYKNNTDNIDFNTSTSLTELRKAILTIETKNDAKASVTLAEYKARSQQVKKYALLRANGICELCNRTAPFISEGNFPFLEVHHIYRLADDGPDLPINVSAICPNCHKEAHYGIRKYDIRDELVGIISKKELGII